MSYQSDIYAAIQASTAITAIIGNRFFWDIADGSTVEPYLVAQTISSNGETDFDGNRDLSFPLIQITAWAKGKAEGIAIISTLRSELEGVTLSGASDASLGYAGEGSNYDSASRLHGEIIEFRVSTLTN